MERVSDREYEQEPEHEGEHYLRLLGLEEYADHEIVTASGVIPVRDFLDICGEHARPVLAGFESLSPEDPRYEPTKGILRDMIGTYVNGGSPSR